MSDPPRVRGALAVFWRVGRLLQFLPRAVAWLLVAAWMGGIAYLSSLPASDLPPAPFGAFSGNFAHAVAFGMLALWAALGVKREGGWPRLDARTIGAILVMVLIYAVIDEWHQSRSPGRTPSVYDVMTDLAGAGATLAVAAYVGRAGAREGGLWLRLAVGAAVCAFTATLATLG